MLKVTYKLRAHNLDQFENILRQEIIPVAEDMGLNLRGVWRSFIGNVGEYVELWEFDSLQAFETEWAELLKHPQIQEIFQTTGPMVEDEEFSIYQPIWEKQQ